MNKLEALRLFCAAADSGNFRQTALLLGVSPQAVTRAVAFLEQEFGDALFVRNTRTTAITPFGRQVYAEAKTALAHTDALFQQFSRKERESLAGPVRVALPEVDEWGLLEAVLHGLRDYPEIVPDWRSGNALSNTDREQIDVGVRVGVPQANDFIIHPAAPLRLQTVMSPELLARTGAPHSVADLRARFPLVGLLDINSGKLFEYDYPHTVFAPEAPAFIAPNNRHALQAVLQGRAAGQFAAWTVQPHIRQGRLKTVLPDDEMTLNWQLYVYRPRRHRHTARVKIVFDLLAEALTRFFHDETRTG
ncbi:LysR family transcriptional regulator [Bergeriella denitrificans]|uniref:LysR family transcriptional regulator n=1 Tax=Bergeriella denitrificans TaxID=494 RepID=A0A378UJ52_BERDE|nr:LysR family transcriptional regulator [Bergeriella denitrificans]STZ77315.1 LysR family transcriptional regulator [Bergeriella denitrificans]